MVNVWLLWFMHDDLNLDLNTAFRWDSFFLCSTFLPVDVLSDHSMFIVVSPRWSCRFVIFSFFSILVQLKVGTELRTPATQNLDATQNTAK